MDQTYNPVFFDDNIGGKKAKIIDVRNVDTNDSIPFETSKNKYIYKVEPFDAIMNPKSYF